MTPRSWSVGLAAGMLLGTLIACPRTDAKPPDLPANPTNTVSSQASESQETFDSVVVAPDWSETACTAAGWTMALGLLATLHPALVYLPFAGEPLLATSAGAVRVEVAETATGSLVFGMDVNSNGGVTGSIVVLGAAGSAEDAPTPGTACATRTGLCSELTAFATTALSPMRPGARRQLAACLLFGIDPLLALVPTSRMLDFPCDHPVAAAPGRSTPMAGEYHFVCGLPAGAEPTIGCDPGVPTPPCGGPCTRERQAAADRATCLPPDRAMGPTVMDQLARLQAAQCLLETGEQLGQHGLICEALECFEAVETLCPGRFDARVSEAVARIFARRYEAAAENEAAEERSEAPKIGFWHALYAIAESAVEACSRCRGQAGTAESQEESEAPGLIEAGARRIWFPDGSSMPASGPVPTPSACPRCEAMHARWCGQQAKGASPVRGRAETEEVPSGPAPGVREQVTGLLKACHLAVADGRYQRAVELAREAFALDPERVSADPLVYKMQLLAKPPKARARRKGASCPARPGQGQGAFLHPSLPPVTSEVVNALDDVLTESRAGEQATCPAARTGSASTEEQEPYPLCKQPAASGTASAPMEQPGLLGAVLDQVSASGPLAGTIALGLDEAGLLFSCDVPVGRSIYHLRYVQGVPAFFVTDNGAATDKDSDDQPR